MDHKFTVKVDTGGMEEFEFDDTDYDFDNDFEEIEPEPVEFKVEMDVVDPLAHLTNDIEIKLKIRKTFDDNIMITDHENIDIVIKPADHTITTFPKDAYDDLSYRTEERFFEYLSMKGAIDRENVEGGNVYGSLMSSYVDISNPNQSTVQMVIFLISKWMEAERPNFKFNKEMSRAYIDKLTNIEKLEDTDPEVLAKQQHMLDKYRLSGDYAGVSGANHSYQAAFYYEE